MPVRPEHIPSALGLSPINAAGARAGQLQHRVAGDYQQVRFLAQDVGGRRMVEKEYWLDRRSPRLVRRVILRDERGEVAMVSELSDYRPVAGGSALLPHAMVATWPTEGARMEFEVGRWELVPQVGPAGPQFATPPDCQSGIAANQ